VYAALSAALEPVGMPALTLPFCSGDLGVFTGSQARQLVVRPPAKQSADIVAGLLCQLRGWNIQQLFRQ